jgi:small redox-active disulfide protein 2
MKIQVLGMGCANCKKLFERTKNVVNKMGLECEVEYVDDMQKIAELGVMSSPVLAIDGQPVIAGYVPDEKEIAEAIASGDECREGDCCCKCDGGCC